MKKKYFFGSILYSMWFFERWGVLKHAKTNRSVKEILYDGMRQSRNALKSYGNLVIYGFHTTSIFC